MAEFVADLDGFREAQKRLVANLGMNVSFSFAPQAYVYPSGTYIDPETGTALDPRIEPTMVITPAPITEQATILRNVPTLANEGDYVKDGIIPTGKAWLRIPEGTYSSGILAADKVTFNSETFKIVRFINDGIGFQADRLYVECQYDEGGITSPAPSGTVPLSGEWIKEQFTAVSTQTTYTLAAPLEVGSTIVSVGGLMQTMPDDYVELPQAIQLTYNPVDGQNIIVWYRVA